MIKRQAEELAEAMANNRETASRYDWRRHETKPIQID